FPVGERIGPAGQRLGGQRGIDHAASGVHRPDRLGEFLGGGVLDDETAGSGLQRTAQIPGATEGGHDQRPYPGQLPRQRAGGFDPVPTRHLNVQQAHLRLVFAGRGHHLLPAADLGHHVQVPLKLQQGRHRPAYECLVIGQQHPDRVLYHCTSTCVPPPGGEVTVNVPPAACTRSRAPRMPCPGGGASVRGTSKAGAAERERPGAAWPATGVLPGAEPPESERSEVGSTKPELSGARQAAAPGPTPSSLTTRPCGARVIVQRVAREWRTTFVIASRSTHASTRRCRGSTAPASVGTSLSMPASCSASRAFCSSSPRRVTRSPATVARISARDSRVIDWIWASSALAASGSASTSRSASWDFMVITV